MAFPSGAADLVADQKVRGVTVGNAQERLGEAHQHHAFLGIEAEFNQERVEAAGFAALPAHAFHQCPGEGLGALLGIERQLGARQQVFYANPLIGAAKRADGGT